LLLGLLELVEASRLNSKSICIAILQSCLLRLRGILVVQIPCGLRLLCEWVTKPIHSRLLLVALIPSSSLRLSRSRSIIEQ